MSIYPTSPLKLRRRNSARLDVLTTMLNQSSSEGNSPHDSLSPLDNDRELDFGKSASNNELSLFQFDTDVHGERSPGLISLQQDSDFTCLKPDESHEVATTFASTTQACSPRSTLIVRNRRPTDLHLTKTNGLTTVPLPELKQCICDARTGSAATQVQVPRPKANQLPKTPATPSPLIVMGNRPSSIAGSPIPDNASLHSVVRRPAKLVRKSSANPFKRIDSHTPLPRNLTGTVLQVQQEASFSSCDGATDRNEDNLVETCVEVDKPSDDLRDIEPPHSASTATITNENAFQPLSTSTIVNEFPADRSNESRTDSRSRLLGNRYERFHQQSRIDLRHLALSPSIPAPSPLPEDSPHKYGLKDRMETPDMLEPEEINVAKVRRRSSGLDVFNEAKSLQSASSFLNGLSTSRRRAESIQGHNEASSHTLTSYDAPRPYSSRPQSRPSSRPNLQHNYSSERCPSAGFKPSGFSYSRPLNINQMKCYRSHTHMLPSRNKKASVECSVCHIDDDRDHYLCSWCALRMCRFCRKDFAERGLSALKERIKQAELGNPSSSSSSDSLGGLTRGRKPYV